MGTVPGLRISEPGGNISWLRFDSSARRRLPQHGRSVAPQRPEDTPPPSRYLGPWNGSSCSAWSGQHLILGTGRSSHLGRLAYGLLRRWTEDPHGRDQSTVCIVSFSGTSGPLFVGILRSLVRVAAEKQLVRSRAEAEGTRWIVSLSYHLEKRDGPVRSFLHGNFPNAG